MKPNKYYKNEKSMLFSGITAKALGRFSFSMCLSLFISCEEFIKVDVPKTQIVSRTVFSDDATASAAMRGIYSRIMENDGFASGGATSITILAGLSADEFSVNSSDRQEFYTNSLLSTDLNIFRSLWSQPYNIIYNTNLIIEGTNNSEAVTESTKKQLEGEAKFIRAFCHFYLVNMFGDIPLATSTDYRVNSTAQRISKEIVYQQIIADLKDAQNLLSDDYITGEKVRPNKSSATALLARAYLYTHDWASAEIESTAVISNSRYSLVENLNDVFLANSSEAIWQLMPVAKGFNTFDGISFNIAILSDTLLNSFEINDNRKIFWTTTSNFGLKPFKYKISEDNQEVAEYSMVLRLAEQYLIRAEARAQQNDIISSQEDLNAVRNRAGLPGTQANDQISLLQAIEHERQIELFSEWGHRWFDLKRTSRADEILTLIKAPNWEATDELYPIPQSEISVNPNLAPQNLGY